MTNNRKHEWKIGTINVRTGKEDEKIERIVREVDKAGLYICALQEVRRLNKGSAIVSCECENSLNKYEIHWSGNTLKRHHGVGFIIKVDPNIEVTQIDCVSARVIVLHVRVYGCLLRIINCYAPTEDSSESSKTLFYRTLHRQFKNVPKKQKVICLGDFNATTSASLYASSLRENCVIENLIVNDNGERFHDLIQTQKLSVLNTWFNHKHCRRVTWHSPDGTTKKVYDFILCCSWLRQFTTNCRVYNSFDFDSDHRLVVAHMKTPRDKVSRYVKRIPKTVRKKYDLSALQSEEASERFITKVSESLAGFQMDNVDNSVINNHLIKSIKDAAVETLPEVVAQKLYQPWHNDQTLSDLYSRKDELFAKNGDKKTIQLLRKKIRKRSRYLRNEYFKAEAQKLNQLAVNRELDKLFARAKQQSTTLKPCSGSCPPDKLLDHFKAHFNPANQLERPRELSNELPDFVKSLQDISASIDINTQPPTIDEITAQLRKLKNGKASNDIEPELLKKSEHPIMLQVIQRMTSNLWGNLDVPPAWGNSRLTTLWKGKGSKKDPTKYRGLSNGSIVCKLIVNIVLSRLRPWYEAQLTQEQNGFRSNRGTTDSIYTVKRIQQIASRKMQPIYLLFVDLTAAFDHIPREWMFESVRLRFADHQDTRLIDILEKLYENTSLTFEDAKSTFVTTSGVRQGGTESPNLFNLYVDFVMRVFIDKCSEDDEIKFFEHKFRINSHAFTREDRLYMRSNNMRSWGSSVLPWSGYADDIVLFLLSQLGLQKATELLDSVFLNFGLHINTDKTQTMLLNADNSAESFITLRNVKLKNVPLFNYLGTCVDSSQPATGDSEINHRIQLACVKFAEMSNLLQNHHINLHVRVTFLNCYVRSRLTHACQNWTLNESQVNRLDCTYRMFLRRMVRNGFKYVDRQANDFRLVISNAQLHTICGTRDVSGHIRNQQLKYASHVVRMPLERSVKQLSFNDDVYTKRGRSCRSLIDQVIHDRAISLDNFCSLSISKKI